MYFLLTRKRRPAATRTETGSSRARSPRVLATAALGLLVCVPPALSQTGETSAASAGTSGQEEVVVTGLRNPAGVTAKQLRAMLEAYNKNRARYAPQSTFYVTYDEASGADATLPAIKLVGRAATRVLPLDGNNQRVVLPTNLNAKDDYRLVTDRSRKALKVSLLIASPGTSIEDRSIGDLRLQCEVMWAAVKQETSFLLRAAFGAAGACKSSRINFYFGSPRVLDRAVLVHAGREVPLRIASDKRGYRAPIYDKTVPSSARVRLHYAS